MLSFLKWTFLLVALLPEVSIAAQVQLAPGNGVWLKPSSTPIPGNEATLVSSLKERNLAHVFLWTIGYTSTQYSTFAPFIQQAHARGLTVHAVCATKTTVSSGTVLSATLLANVLQEVEKYNAAHPAAKMDGAQIDIEGVTGSALLNLVSAVTVPETLVFSAAIQPNEYYSKMESYYNSLLQNTDLDLLIPMIYIMDGIYYSGGEAKFTFDLAKIRSKTASIMALLPSGGKLMTGLAAYDREFPILKATQGIDRDYLDSIGQPDGWSMPAFSTHSSSSKSVPNLVAQGKPFQGVSYRTNVGVSIYRFDNDTTRWVDVLEMTPLGVRESIRQAEQGAGTNPKFIGTCTWLYHTTFDQYSGRLEGFTPDDALHPQPVVKLEILEKTPARVRLRVSLTNAQPSERLLGAPSSAGVHLRLQGATLVSAAAGTFHSVQAFSASGAVLGNIQGAQILELRRSFFENAAAPQALSGEISVNPSVLFTIHYRAWLTDKDSTSPERGVSESYVARSPDDLHYQDPSRWLAYATFSTNIVVATNLTCIASNLEPGALRLVWPSGNLHEAANILGPWTLVTGAVAPCYQVQINPTNPMRFFRVQ